MSSSEWFHLDVEVEGEKRWYSALLQHSVVALSLETVFGEVLRADVAVFGGLEVVSPHRSHPFTTNIWTRQRKPGKNDKQIQLIKKQSIQEQKCTDRYWLDRN